MIKNDLIQKAKSVTNKMIKMGYWSKAISFVLSYQFKTWKNKELENFIKLYEK